MYIVILFYLFIIYFYLDYDLYIMLVRYDMV